MLLGTNFAVLLSFIQQCGHHKGTESICKSLKIVTSLHPIEFNDLKILKMSINIKIKHKGFRTIIDIKDFGLFCFELQYFIAESQKIIPRPPKVFLTHTLTQWGLSEALTPERQLQLK